MIKFLLHLLLVTNIVYAVENELNDPRKSILLCMRSTEGDKAVFKTRKIEWEEWREEGRVILIQENPYRLRAVHLTRQYDYEEENLKLSLFTYYSQESGKPIVLENEEKKIIAHVQYHKDSVIGVSPRRNPAGLSYDQSERIFTAKIKKQGCLDYCEIFVVPSTLNSPEEQISFCESGPDA